LDNGIYGETGSQPSHAGLGCDLSAVASACGIADAWKVSSESELQDVISRFHTRGSVRFLQVLVSTEQHERVMPTRDAVENKLRFCESISAGV
jgi:thiamine pyrophosphate-dependent acetolactate synthase large subunit-like protein